MTISLQCQCSRVITVSSELAGQPTRCPACGRRHIVPIQKPILPPQPEPVKIAVVELAEACCADCNTPLVKEADFCHKCGLPTPWAKPAEPVEVVPPPPVIVSVSVPQMQMQMAAKPGMCGPFGEARECCRPVESPFARQMAQAAENRPQSGLGRVAMTCAFMAIFLGIFAALFTIPLLGNRSGEIALGPHQIGSLLSLLHGMVVLGSLFCFVGIISGFFGLFHFNRRKSAAFWGMALCLMVAVGLKKGHDRIEAKFRPQQSAPVQKKDSNAQPQLRTIPAPTQQQAAPKAAPKPNANPTNESQAESY